MVFHTGIASGYWQVAMDASTKEKAAFVTSGGLYEWNVMPFRLYNAPSTFARLMELVLKGLHWKICLIYLDMIVMVPTFEEELERLKQVFERLAHAGLKLKPKKCFLFRKRVSYLGHVVTEEGITADPEKGGTNSYMARSRKQHGGQKLPRTCLLLSQVHPRFLNCSTTTVQANRSKD